MKTTIKLDETGELVNALDRNGEDCSITATGYDYYDAGIQISRELNADGKMIVILSEKCVYSEREITEMAESGYCKKSLQNLVQSIRNWDKASIYDLREHLKDLNMFLSAAPELDRKADDYIDMSSLPSIEIPRAVNPSYSVWAMDKAGRCLVGVNAESVEHIENIANVSG